MKLFHDAFSMYTWIRSRFRPMRRLAPGEGGVVQKLIFPDGIETLASSSTVLFHLAVPKHQAIDIDQKWKSSACLIRLVATTGWGRGGDLANPLECAVSATRYSVGAPSSPHRYS